MLIHSAIFTGSLSLNSTDLSSTTGSAGFATTSSVNAIIAQTASFATTSSINAIIAQTASFATTASVATLIQQTGSYASTSSVDGILAKTGSYASTGSNQFSGSQTVTGSLTVTGNITAQTLVVQTITASVEFVTGSNRFGSTTGNTHEFTGSLLVTGSQSINGSITATSSTLSGAGSDRLIMTRTNIGTYHLAISGDDRFSIYDPSVDRERISITASGSVGIGVTPSIWNSAYTVLQIGSTGTLFQTPSNTILGQNIFVNSADNNAYLTSNFATQYRQVNGQHIWYYAASGTAGSTISFTQAMTLTAGGNLGVGMTDPGQKIQTGGRVRVSPDNTNGGDIGVNDGGLAFSTIGATPIQFWTSNYTTQTFKVASNGDIYANNNAALFFGSSALTYLAGGNTSMTLAVNNATALSFNSSRAASFTNNVSATGYIYTNSNLGTANGNQTAGAASATLFLGNRGYFTTPDVGAATIRAISTGTYWYSGTALSFSTNPGPDVTAASAVERMRIESTGKIITNANTSDYTLVLYNGASNAYGMYMQYTGYSPNSTNYEFIYCIDSTNSKFIVWSNGSVVNRTGSYGTISDIKYKENIVDATPKLADIMNLKVRNFNLKGESTKQIGFIAQEFEEVFPSMIDTSTEKGGDGETYKSIKTSVLVPMLVKAIQEQQAQIEELKALLNA